MDLTELERLIAAGNNPTIDFDTLETMGFRVEDQAGALKLRQWVTARNFDLKADTAAKKVTFTRLSGPPTNAAPQ